MDKQSAANQKHDDEISFLVELMNVSRNALDRIARGISEDTPQEIARRAIETLDYVHLKWDERLYGGVMDAEKHEEEDDVGDEYREPRYPASDYRSRK